MTPRAAKGSKHAPADAGPVRVPRDRALAFLGLVRAGEVLAHDLDADLQAAHGLGLRAYEILLHLALYSPSNSLRMTRLAEQAPLSQSRVSRLVAELESKDLVRRTPAADDARGIDVAITERGLAVFAEAHPTHLESLERLFFSRLTKAETAQLGKITAKLLRAPLLLDPEPP